MPHCGTWCEVNWRKRAPEHAHVGDGGAVFPQRKLKTDPAVYRRMLLMEALECGRGQCYPHHTRHTLTTHGIPSPHTRYHHHTRVTLTTHALPSPRTRYHHHTRVSLTTHAFPSPHTRYPHHTRVTLTILALPSPHTRYPHHTCVTITTHTLPSPHTRYPHHTPSPHSEVCQYIFTQSNTADTLYIIN